MLHKVLGRVLQHQSFSNCTVSRFNIAELKLQTLEVIHSAMVKKRKRPGPEINFFSSFSFATEVKVKEKNKLD